MLAKLEDCINSWIQTSAYTTDTDLHCTQFCPTIFDYQREKASITCLKTHNIYHVEIRPDFYSPCQIPYYDISVVAS